MIRAEDERLLKDFGRRTKTPYQALAARWVALSQVEQLDWRSRMRTALEGVRD